MTRGQAFGLSTTARLALVQRLARRREGQEAQASADPRGFGSVQNLKDWGLVRDAMDALGIESPFFRAHDGRAGATSLVGNREVINFGSYDYLGLNGDPRLHQAAAEAMARHGISASASRLVSGERPVHRELERRLAAHYGAEAALAFVSGHATNVTVIGHLMGRATSSSTTRPSTIPASRARGCRARGASPSRTTTSPRRGGSLRRRGAARSARCCWSRATTRWMATCRTWRASSASPACTMPG
jgi:hypothetical protein